MYCTCGIQLIAYAVFGVCSLNLRWHPSWSLPGHLATPQFGHFDYLDCQTGEERGDKWSPRKKRWDQLQECKINGEFWIRNSVSAEAFALICKSVPFGMFVRRHKLAANCPKGWASSGVSVQEWKVQQNWQKTRRSDWFDACTASVNGNAHSFTWEVCEAHEPKLMCPVSWAAFSVQYQNYCMSNTEIPQMCRVLFPPHMLNAKS